MLKFIKLFFAIVFIFSVSDALAQKWESITGDDREPKRSSQSERSSPQKKLNVTGGDTATMLANAAKKYEKAVGLMVFTHSETGPLPHCTAASTPPAARARAPMLTLRVLRRGGEASRATVPFPPGGGAGSGGEGSGEGSAAGSAAWHLPAPSSRSNSVA